MAVWVKFSPGQIILFQVFQRNICRLPYICHPVRIGWQLVMLHETIKYYMVTVHTALIWIRVVRYHLTRSSGIVLVLASLDLVELLAGTCPDNPNIFYCHWYRSYEYKYCSLVSRTCLADTVYRTRYVQRPWSITRNLKLSDQFYWLNRWNI